MSWQDLYTPDQNAPAWQAHFVPDATASSIPSVDPYARDLQIAHPMEQSMSNIPEGQNKLPPEQFNSGEGTSSFEMDKGKWSKVPDFVKTAQMNASGAMAGSLTFASNLLSQVPGMKDLVQNANQSWEDKRKEYEAQGFSPTAFNIGKGAAELNQANLLLKSPMNLVSGISSGAQAMIGGAAGRAAQYGVQALGNTALFAGLSSQQYDPNEPGQLFNADAAAATMKDPKMYAMNAAGTFFSNWMKNSGALADAQAVDPNAMMRNLNQNPAAQAKFGSLGIAPDATGGNAARKIKDLFFGITPALTEMGKQSRQAEGMESTINGMVQNLSGETPTPAVGAVDRFIQGMAGSKQAQAVATNADQLTQWSSNIVQSTMAKMERAEDKAWGAGFKSTPISTEADPVTNLSPVQAVKDSVINARDALLTSKLPGNESIINNLNNVLRDNPTLDVGAVKQLNTILSGASINARSVTGGIYNTLANTLKGVKDDLLSHIQSSLSPEDMQSYNAAVQLSAHKFNLFDNVANLESAVTDATASHKLVTSLVSEGGVLPPKQAVMGELSPGGQNMIAALKIRQALEKADNGSGRINLDSFLNATGPNSQTAAILPEAAQKQLAGLQVYLKNVDDSQKVGWWRQAAVGGTLAAASGLGMYENQDTTQSIAVPLVAYSALSMIANHSPLKLIFNAMTKDLPQGTFDALTKAAAGHLTRAGYIMSDHGVLSHKNDQRPSDVPQPAPLGMPTQEPQ